MGAGATVGPKVAEYCDRNLSYVGEAKLNALGRNDLCELLRRVVLKTHSSPVTDAAMATMSPTELVAAILRLKPKLKTASESAPAVANPTAIVTKVAPEAPPRPTTPAPDAQPACAPRPKPNDKATPEVAKQVSAIVEGHTLKICSFNSNKLSLHRMESVGEDPSEEATLLRDHWLDLIDVMAEFDVIVMQEVPKSEKDNPKRTRLVSVLLHAAQPNKWCEPIFSSPSGVAGGDAKRAEVHVCWVCNSIVIEKQHTLTNLVLDNRTTMQLDYAPLQLLLYDDRFANPDQRRVVLTSVHMAPESRAATRDAQLKALLSSYSDPGSTAYRLGTNFSRDGGPHDGRPIHVIAGDFNVYPGATIDTKHGKKLDEPEEAYGLTRRGFVAQIPRGAATSVGKKNYDNFLIDVHSKSRYQIHGTILKLAMPKNAAKSQAGLSDHHPIMLEVIDTETVTVTERSSSSSVLPRRAGREAS